MSPAPFYPLEHWAGLSGRIFVRRGPRTTSLTKDWCLELLAKTQRTGRGVHPAGVPLDESDLIAIRNTYFDEVAGFAVEEAHEVTVGPFDDDASYALDQARRASALHAMCGPDEREF